jgi:hypothetical protein
MKHLHAVAFSFALLALTACTATRAQLPTGVRTGLEMQAQEPVHFAIVDASPAKFYGQTVLVEATVRAVCKKKQCWMQFEDGGKVGVVRWDSGCGQYKFPEDAIGKRVLIQGKLVPKEAAAAQAASAASAAYDFKASSVLVLDEKQPS